MSDPVTNMEIEDVLSSIRRLVSDEPRPKAAAAPKAQPERLILTPAQRVPAEAPESDGEEGRGDSAKSSERAAPLLLRRDPEAVAAADTSPATSDVRKLARGDVARVMAAELLRAAVDGALVESPASSRSEDDPGPEQGLGDVSGRDVEQKADADESAADPVAATENEECAQDDTDNAQMDAGDEASRSIQFIAEVSDSKVERVAPSDEAASAATLALIEAAVAPQHPEKSATATEQEAHAAGDGASSEAETSRERDDGAADPKADFAATITEQDDHAPIGTPDEAMRSLDDVAEESADGPGEPRLESGLERKIAELEDMISRSAEHFDPDSEDGHAAFVHRVPEPLDWVDHSVIQEAPRPTFERSNVLRGPEWSGKPSGQSSSAPVPSGDEETRLADDGQFLDEEGLRDLVAEIVRQELQGALGERITRNVRKLVRREIHRVLTSQEFE